MRVAHLMAALIAATLLAGPADAVELRFQTGNSANLFWMVDQISGWDARYTSPAYREYWDKKIRMSADDYAMLDKYSRLRRRLARLEEGEVRKETSPWVALFGRTSLLPHEQFALAFFETSTPADAVALLKLSSEDGEVVVNTLKYFARRMKDQWSQETAHLKAFNEKAQVLVSLADAGGYIDQMKSFFGIKGAIPDLTVDVLWAPPGFGHPTHLLYHIMLPVSVENSESDEAVLQLLSAVMQQGAAYLLSKLPPETLAAASRKLVSECGYINPGDPDMVKEALQVALGEVLFLRERFTDLPRGALLVPYDGGQEFPYATDVLAREFAVAIKPLFSTPGAFYPAFVDKAVEVQQRLFPPRPRFFASTGLLLAGKETGDMFEGEFAAVDRVRYDVDDIDEFIETQSREPGRAVFIVVTAKDDGKMWQALKGANATKKLANDFTKLKGSPFIYPIDRPGSGMIFVIRGADVDDVRRALIHLYTMERLPAGPVSVE